MSGIPEDARFEEPELACMLENFQKGRMGSSKGFWRGKKGWSKGESRGGLKLSTKEASKGGRPENYKQHRLKLQSYRLNRGLERAADSWNEQKAWSPTVGSGGLSPLSHPLFQMWRVGASREGLPSEQGVSRCQCNQRCLFGWNAKHRCYGAWQHWQDQ